MRQRHHRPAQRPRCRLRALQDPRPLPCGSLAASRRYLRSGSPQPRPPHNSAPLARSAPPVPLPAPHAVCTRPAGSPRPAAVRTAHRSPPRPMGAERRCGTANGSGGRGHPTVAAGGWAGRASRALAGGGRGGHGGAGFALFPRDSPPAPACTAQPGHSAAPATAARYRTHPSGWRQPLPASLPACRCPARPSPLRAVTPCCTEEPRSALLLCPAQIPAPSRAAQSLRGETSHAQARPARGIPPPRPPAASTSRDSLNLRPAPRAALPKHRRVPVPRSAQPAVRVGAGRAEGSGQGPHPALSRPSGAAAILAGRGRRRRAGNGGRGAVRAPGAPSALRAPLAAARGFHRLEREKSFSSC